MSFVSEGKELRVCVISPHSIPFGVTQNNELLWYNAEEKTRGEGEGEDEDDVVDEKKESRNGDDSTSYRANFPASSSHIIMEDGVTFYCMLSSFL